MSEIGEMVKKGNPEKRFKCDMCEYTTSRASDLKKHVMGVHGNVKSLKCEMCEYTSRASDMKKHVLGVRVHDKVKSERDFSEKASDFKMTV